MTKSQRLGLRYATVGDRLFGLFYVDGRPLSQPYAISKRLVGAEVTHGGVLSLLDKILRQMVEFEHRLSVLRSEVVERQAKGLLQPQYTSQQQFTDLVLHHQEGVCEDVVLVVMSYFRTLAELFPSRCKQTLDVYDFYDKRVDSIPLTHLANALAHHRYLVIRDESICDVMSSKIDLPSNNLVGSKIRVIDFLNAVLACVYAITVNDFVGLLRRQIERSANAAEPAARDAVFLMQNVHSLSRIIGDQLPRIAPGTSKIHGLLLQHALRRDATRIGLNGYLGRGPVLIHHSFATPRFQLDEDLSARKLLITVLVDEVPNVVQVGFEEFLALLSEDCGNEPLVEFRGYGTVTVHTAT